MTLTDPSLNVKSNDNGEFMYISQPQVVDKLYSEIKSCDPLSSNITSEQKEVSFEHNSKTSMCHESIVLAEDCDDSNENLVICKIDEPGYDSEINGSLEKWPLSSKNGTLFSSRHNFENDPEGFRCHICSYLLPSSRTLRHHLVKSHDVKNTHSFYCPLCEHECWSEKQLNYHLYLHHEVKRTDLACSICGMQLSSRCEVKAHLRKHILHYSCPVCPQKFGARHQLALHAQHHISKLKPHVCTLCGRRFKHTKAFFLHEWRHEKQSCPEMGCHDQFEDESYLLVHLRIIHKIGELQHENLVFMKDQLDRNIDALFCQFYKRQCQEGLTPKYPPENNNPLLKFIFETKDESFMNQDNWKELKMKLQKNNLSFNNVLDLKCVLEELLKNENKSLKEEDLNELENILYKNNFNHLCGLCNHNFSSLELLNAHMNQHRKNHICHICSRLFPSVKILRKHCFLHKFQENTSDNGGESNVVKCPECGKLFSHRKSLIRHAKVSHKHSCKFRCKTCKKTFTTKGHLNEHALQFHKQTGGKRMPCPFCDKFLSSAKNLAIHLHLHGEEDSVHPANIYSCPKCKKKFGRKQLLLRHMLQHNAEHKCAICDKVLASACKLSSHLSSHDKELKHRFPCEVCDLKFSYKSQLRVHSLTHTGEKPFVCEICGKRFKRLQQCKVHSNLVHSKTRVQCNECLKHFGTTSNLIRHRIAFHVNLKRWICGICSHSYAHSQDLRLHLKKIHQYELTNIDYKSKKRLGEIYVIPALNSYDITDDMKLKVKQVYREESEKLREMYRETDKEVTRQIEHHAPFTSEREIPLVSVLNPLTERREAEGKIISHPIEILPLRECAYCKSRAESNLNIWISCDLCSAFVCSSVHLNGHKSEVHIGYQCFSCNLKFPSKDLCVNHIEKSHIQTPYQIDPKGGHSLITHQICARTPLLTSIPQMRTLHIVPPQNPTVQLVTIPASDYGSVMNLSTLQENAVFLATEQPNYELVHVAPVNQEKTLSQASIRGNSFFNMTSDNANFFPLVDPSTEIIKPNEMLTVAVGNGVFQLPELHSEDQRQAPRWTALTTPEREETSYHLTQEKDNSGTVNLVLGSCNINGSVRSAGLTCQQNEILITPNDITNSYNFQMLNNPNDNGSVVSVLLSLAGLVHDGQETEFVIPQASECCEISKLKQPVLPLVKFVKPEQLNCESTASLPAMASEKGVITTIPLNNGHHYEIQDSKESIATQTIYEDQSTTLPGLSELASHQNVGGVTTKAYCCAKLASSDSEEDVSNTESSSSVVLKCQTCGKVFTTLPQLERHKRIHDLKRYKCQICDKSFVEKFNLKTHVMIHTQEKPRHCEKCGKKFRYFRDLKDHLRSHEGLLPFTCISCNLKFLRGRDLTRHIKEQHSKLKHKCLMCGREFKRKFYLEKVHLKTHTKKLSIDNSSNDNHLGSVPPTMLISATEETKKIRVQASKLLPFTCNVCKEQFSRKRTLTSHLKTHKQ